MNHLKQDLAALGQAVLKYGKGEMGDTGKKLKAEIQERIDELAAGIETARERGKESVEALQVQIESHPFASIGIALVSGLILSQLFSWRSASEKIR